MEDAGHSPVLLETVVELLSVSGGEPSMPEGIEGRLIVDGTVGRGGHAEALLAASAPQTRLIGIDLDESCLLKTKERLARFGTRVRLFRANFADMAAVLDEAGERQADAVLVDLGVCSAQLDDPQRGFSVRTDGPLDMRLGQDGPTAADLVNRLGESELADLIYRLGQERHARGVARAIVQARRESPIRRTARLAEIVARAVRRPGSRQKIHPATRTFQALRMAVNGELDSLDALLDELPGRLAPGGRAAVISFHSLEDRRVKQAFAAAARAGTHRLLTPKPLTPGTEELRQNPRSRSAKLRAMERIR